MPWAPRLGHKTFFLVFTYSWQEDIVKIFEVPKAPRKVNPARTITCLVYAQPSIASFSTITFHLTLPVFTQQNSFKKQI